MRTMWPLFWMLPAKSQAALMEWHWDNYGTRLNIPPPPETSNKWKVKVTEASDEIDHFIRQAPQHQRKAE